MNRIYLLLLAGRAAFDRLQGLRRHAHRARQPDLRKHSSGAAGVCRRNWMAISARVRRHRSDWSPKGQLLIATRFADVDQLHLVEQAGGARRQLTFLHEPITEAAFSPDPARSAFVFLKDSGGNENAQLYYQRLGDPAAKMLTDGKSLNGAPDLVQQRPRSRVLQQRSRWPKLRHRYRGSGIGHVAAPRRWPATTAAPHGPCSIGRPTIRNCSCASKFPFPRRICTSWI